ncbi:unnamed protein product [Caenorhabditis brenneri]
MKLLRFPYLAQKEILKQMNYEELFLISLISKRSMRMIQSIKRKEITKIDISTSEKLYNFCAGSDKRAIVTLHHESRPTDRTLRKEITLRTLVCRMEYEDQLLPHLTINSMLYLEQEYLHITIRGLIGNLSSNSRLYSITGLVMETWDTSLATAVLSNFKGRRLILKNVSGIDNEICQFIERWKSCQELENFDYLSVFMDAPGFANIDEIKRIAGFKDLTPEAKAFGQIVRSIHSSYVVRDDGIVAKTHINRRGISMNVQQFTEEQMLKGKEVVV